ncbi:MAG: phenylalanine--tRNA ligase subunit beta [Bacteroidetes bacterium]|jgi:phenylalanyl-tRNA synthetase beta chain|nr:phenylalanine--tRNA ligase subunit beta [Bacteroidota bacterium]MBT4401501.1 phenylalanine--tRNA ligase subunit beta [Bacteroidota bacterium]MBT7093227.1 phenylalanine--tRNA ligase subunit beta [Bacteroidota bacterium]MBT7463074.1 phenylalanine--tRNA ligase subunit beta [Bacteroidota bacterium]
MNISYNWLKNYVDFNLTPEELSAILTDTGLEVEGLESYQSIKGGLEGLIIGEVVECQPHPNADKLSITKVDVGQNELLPIVCGAPNVAAGQKVIVAPVGTTLYMGTDALKIKKTKIRGEISQGMICAEDEIGIGDDHEGIIEIDTDIPAGQAASTVIPVENDTVIEIGLTPNRIDGASHIGTARDVVAFLNLDESKVNLQIPDVSSFSVDNHELEIPVEIEDQSACIRYSGVSLTGLTVEESPDWLKNRLKAIGLKPINNVVDITNFVLHETGQPLHAFDASKISGKKIIVKTLPDKTQFTSLDEENRELSNQDLMICSENEGMCIAGVFGGIDSGVTETTTEIFIESACFNPVQVRKTAKRHGLNTDSSFRFERGTDPNGTIYALKRAAILIRDLAGGTISSNIADVYPEEIKPYPVKFSWANLDRLVGVQIPHDTVLQILELLDISVVHRTKDWLNLAVATYRVDVKREADVIEEILRIYGYNNVGLSDQVHSTLSYAPNPDPELLENKVAEQLTALGFNEMMANSLTKSSYYNDNEGVPDKDLIKLLNPLSSDLNAMRKNLAYGGLETISLNIKHRRTDLRFYEFGNIYQANPDGNRFSPSGYLQNRRLAIYLTGKKSPENWSASQEQAGFYTIKGYVMQVLARLGIPESDLEINSGSNGILSEGLHVAYRNKTLASFGKINSASLETFHIEQDVYYADFDWDLLLKFQSGIIEYKEVPKYPEVRRDLALVLDKSVEFTSIRNLAFHVERKLLKSVNLFDVFESEKLGQGLKSYAVSFILQDERKTLTDKQIDKIMKSLLIAFEQKLGAKLR